MPPIERNVACALSPSVRKAALLPLVAQSDIRGSWPLLYAATSPEAHGGGYYGPDGIAEIKGAPVEVKPKPHALDLAAGQRLWEISERLTGVRYDALDA